MSAPWLVVIATMLMLVFLVVLAAMSFVVLVEMSFVMTLLSVLMLAVLMLIVAVIGMGLSASEQSCQAHSNQAHSNQAHSNQVYSNQVYSNQVHSKTCVFMCASRQAVNTHATSKNACCARGLLCVKQKSKILRIAFYSKNHTYKLTENTYVHSEHVELAYASGGRCG